MVFTGFLLNAFVLPFEQNNIKLKTFEANCWQLDFKTLWSFHSPFPSNLLNKQLILNYDVFSESAFFLDRTGVIFDPALFSMKELIWLRADLPENTRLQFTELIIETSYANLYVKLIFECLKANLFYSVVDIKVPKRARW